MVNKAISYGEGLRPMDIISSHSKSETLGGNILYNDMIEKKNGDYAAITDRNSKKIVTKDIVKNLKNMGARFMKKNEAGEWEELSEKMARDKVSHALRNAYESQSKKAMAEAAPKTKKHSPIPKIMTYAILSPCSSSGATTCEDASSIATSDDIRECKMPALEENEENESMEGDHFTSLVLRQQDMPLVPQYITNQLPDAEIDLFDLYCSFVHPVSVEEMSCSSTPDDIFPLNGSAMLDEYF
jgi:hypothetical protein